MFLADCHTHSICSPDGAVPMKDMAQGAVEAVIPRLTLTDHCDFLTLEGERLLTYDWQEPLRQLQEMQEAWGQQLDLHLGLEFGMGHLDPKAADLVLSEPALDFVIGSCHNLSEEKGGRDFYFLPSETEADCYAALDDYFASMLHMVEGGRFDVLGHIIYPLRYMKGQYKSPITWKPYMEILREIFTKTAQQGKGMEINTWKGQTLTEWIPLLQLFRACGGEIITVGSDAHAPKPVGRGIREAYALLQEVGFSYVANYEKREAKMYPLKQR